MYTFKGGIHPQDRKELSKDSPIEEAFPSTKTVTIPITMGGKPNEPMVKVGDKVVKGQLIADSKEFISAPVHASISGTVKKISTQLVAGNVEVPCITIQSDETDTTAYLEPLDPFTCSHDEAIKRIRDAGIVGMGGASFPTHVKLVPPAGNVIDYVILNISECEPYLTIDYRTIKETPHKVIDGLAIILKITGGKGIIALEDNKIDVLDSVNAEIVKQNRSNDITVRVLKTKYPEGCEKTLIKACTKREVPTGKLPAESGCLVFNIGTACAIADAFHLGKPLIERGLTISGDACETPKNLLIPIGTVIGDLIPSPITLKPGKVAKILSGGPMMGLSMVNANFPITKGTSGILFLTKEETYVTEESPCIGCGKCIDVCSLRLAPVMMVRALKANNLEKAISFGLMDCIECGSCAYTCPANMRLVQRFRIGKATVKAQRAAEKAKADAAKASETVSGGKA